MDIKGTTQRLYWFDWALYACDDDPEFTETDEFRDDPDYMPDEWLS